MTAAEDYVLTTASLDLLVADQEAKRISREAAIERWLNEAFVLRIELGSLSAELKRMSDILGKVRERLCEMKAELTEGMGSLPAEGPAGLAQLALFGE